MSNQVITLDSALRGLSSEVLQTIGSHLNTKAQCKLFLQELENPTKGSKRFDTDLIRRFENGAFTSTMFEAIIIQLWKPSRSFEPSIRNFLIIAIRIKAYEAASYVTTKLLNEKDPINQGNALDYLTWLCQPNTNERMLTMSSIVYVDTSLELAMNQTETQPMVPLKVHQGYIENITNGYSNDGLIGQGNGYFYRGMAMFASMVYKGNTMFDSKSVAIKRVMKNYSMYRYNFECLPLLCHKNLLQVLGYSSDLPNPCLIYPFMKKGNLNDNLVQDAKAVELDALKRFKISLGIAEALHYLQYLYDTPLIHGNVKSTNILLDEDWTPKLADFGSLHDTREQFQRDPITGVKNRRPGQLYMAPESLLDMQHCKSDMFSFGIVLMEILTGKSQLQTNLEKMVYHIHTITNPKFAEILDKRIIWDIPETSQDKQGSLIIFHIAQLCLKHFEERISAEQAVKILQDLNDMKDKNKKLEV